jgi:phosphatidylserine decarboxylase
MKLRQIRDALLQQEDLNFLLTNRLPRTTLTRFMGRLSRVRQPLVRDVSIGLFKAFCDPNLAEARKQRFDSLHDCFVRELQPGARPFVADSRIVASPCDAIVGACGSAAGTEVFQAKGFPYQISELFGPTQDTRPYNDGMYVTLRLTAGMYHRFHAPVDCTVEHVTYISGDTWNVNPIALKRIERLFCHNERAVLRLRSQPTGHPLAIVAVAAILVASIRLHFLDLLLHLRYRGANEIPCNFTMPRGTEMGWFEHGSTLLLFAPKGFQLAPDIHPGQRICAGQPLLHFSQDFD